MDTDNLSKEAYNAVIIGAEKFHHDLTLVFGVLSGRCANEEEYLNECVELIKEMLADPEKEIAIEDIFFDNPPDVKGFVSALETLLKKISKVQKIPMSKRRFETY